MELLVTILKWEALFQLNVLIWASYFRIKQFLYIWQNNYFTDIPDIYSYVATSEILVHCSLKCGSCSCKKGLGKIHGIKKVYDWLILGCPTRFVHNNISIKQSSLVLSCV